MGKLYVSILLLLFFSHVKAQTWTRLKGPFGGDVQALAQKNDKIYAGTNTGLFVSSDNGSSWSRIEFGIKAWVSALALHENYIIVGTLSGVYVSEDDGASWKRRNHGLSDYYRFCGHCIRGLAIYDNTVYAATDDGLLRSALSDTSWTNVLSGSFTTLTGSRNLMAASIQGVYGPGGSIVVSQDGGATWQYANPPVPPYFTASSITISGSTIYACGYSTVYSSVDRGQTWKEVYSGSGAAIPRSFHASQGKLYIGTVHSGIFVSTDNGGSWTRSATDLAPFAVNCFLDTRAGLFTGTSCSGGIYFTTDGVKWQSRNTGITSAEVYSVVSRGENLYAGGNSTIYTSKDGGKSWKQAALGTHTFYSETVTFDLVDALAANGPRILAGVFGKGAYYSNDNGETWKRITAINELDVTSVAFSGNRQYVCGWGAVYYSDDEWQTYTAATNSSQADLFYELIAADDSVYVSYDDLLFSSDNCSSWQSVSRGLPLYPMIMKLGLDRTGLYAGTFGKGIYSLKKDANTWTKIMSCEMDETLVDMAVNDNHIFTLTNKMGKHRLYHSADRGSAWSEISLQFPGLDITAVSVDESKAYAATLGDGIYIYGKQEETVNPVVQVNGLRLHPNPSRDVVVIEYESTAAENISISVYNTQGKGTYNTMVAVNGKLEHKIDISAFPKGVYFVSLSGSSTSQRTKLVRH